MSGFKSLLIIIGVLISSVSLSLASGMTNAVLNGDYIVSEYNPYQGTPSAALISISFDGNGSAPFQVLYDSVRDLESGILTYSVSSDGRLTLTEGSNIEGYGIVSSDGGVFTLAQTEDDAGIIVGIKKSLVDKAMPWIPLLLLDDHMPLLPPEPIFPADGSCINTSGSTSVTVNFKWAPVEGAKQYYYKVWSSYPPEEFTGWTSETEISLPLSYIHESANYSARWYWQVLSGEGPYLSAYSEIRSVTVKAAAFPCQ